MKGLFAWIGYPQKSVPYRPDARYAGTTKWSYWRLWTFALEGITSFTVAPLKIATYVGLIAAIGALYMAYCAADCLDAEGRFDHDRWRGFRRVFESHVVED
jgi:hypothetical protein